jgi:hypothetical protein
MSTIHCRQLAAAKRLKISHCQQDSDGGASIRTQIQAVTMKFVSRVMFAMMQEYQPKTLAQS